MRELDVQWSSNASSGAQSAIEVHGSITHTLWLVTGSTGVSTATALIQSGFTSSGPWADEAFSTAVSSGTCVALRLTGPLHWVRPVLTSTGMSVRVIGNS